MLHNFAAFLYKHKQTFYELFWNDFYIYHNFVEKQSHIKFKSCYFNQIFMNIIVWKYAFDLEFLLLMIILAGRTTQERLTNLDHFLLIIEFQQNVFEK
jgi:hypothetical protein